MSLTVLIFEKNGTIKEQTIKKFNELELYKKAGLKSSTGFNNRTIWNVDGIKGKSYHLSLFGKIDGRANSENKYEFPPPVDNTLFFGNCILVNKDDDDVPINMTKKEWLEVYDHLYGGFDDIGGEDDEEEEDDELPRTKSGYVKDDFIVDDEDDDEDDEDDDEDEEDDFEEEEEVIKPKRKSIKRVKITKRSKPELVNNFVSSENQPVYLDCTGELSEEEYL
tara:strand:- start:1136 stop:1801 length:666 start_codon:yes stop_codon:yes gene_type:complete